MMPGLFNARLLEFNWLPSRTLHRSRWADYAPVSALQAMHEMPMYSGVWHRHWSRRILESLDLYDVPVCEARGDILQLALMPPDLLTVCARRVGTILCAPRLRCAIAGNQVRAVEIALGPDTYALTRWGDQVPHAGIEGYAFPSAEDAVATIDAWGRAALRLALRNAGRAVWLRAELKLPDEPSVSLPLDSVQALELAQWVNEYAGAA
jgi:type III secretion protein K